MPGVPSYERPVPFDFGWRGVDLNPEIDFVDDLASAFAEPAGINIVWMADDDEAGAIREQEGTGVIGKHAGLPCDILNTLLCNSLFVDLVFFEIVVVRLRHKFQKP